MRRALAEILVEEGLVDEERAAAVAREAEASGQPIVAALASQVPEAVLATALARRLRMAVVELDVEAPDPEALAEVPHELASRRLLLPMSLERPADGPRLLRVAMADPTDGDAIAEVEIATGCRVAPILATVSAVEDAIDRAYRGNVTAVMKLAPGELERARRVPFGGNLSLARPSATPGAGAGPGLGTEPYHHIDEEAPFDLRHRALLELLVSKGVITAEEYQVEVRRLLRERD